MFHRFTIVLHLLNFNISKFLCESPSRDGKGKLDRAAPLLTPQEGIVYKLMQQRRKVKFKKKATKKSYLIKMTNNLGAYSISLQLGKNLFGLFLRLSLLLFNIDDW